MELLFPSSCVAATAVDIEMTVTVGSIDAGTATCTGGLLAAGIGGSAERGAEAGLHIGDGGEGTGI